MENNNRMFITMTVLVAALIVFMIVQDLFFPKQPAKQPVRETQSTQSADSDADSSDISTVKERAFQKIDIPQEKTYDLTFENDLIKVEFDPVGAVIKGAYVKRDFSGGQKTDVKSWDLVHGKGSGDGALELTLGAWNSRITPKRLTGSDNIYHYSRENDTFTFTYKFRRNDTVSGTGEEAGQIVYTLKKIYTFLPEYNVFKLDVHMSNDSNEPNIFDESGFAYSIGWGPGLGEEIEFENKRSKMYNQFVFLEGGNVIKVKPGDKKIFGKNKNNNFATYPRAGGASWVAADSRYFTAVIYPDKQNYDYFFDYRNKAFDEFYTGFSRRTNNSIIDSSFYVYVGAKVNDDLKLYKTINDPAFKVAGAEFEKVRERILFGAGDVVGYILSAIFKVVKNYGLSIILLTILIKLILFPLTFKSMESQEKMSKLQPKFKELQEKYKEDPTQLNKKTMELYKKEKVNPVGGCLPMMLQMPVFIAMYQLLDRMVELKGASFLWISDLSGPEALYTFFLPSGFPFGLSTINVNILPVVMLAFQLLTTVLTPDVSGGNKQTKMMMWAFPLVFFFILYNFASALVLYWTVMNLLNLIQQVYMKKIKPGMQKTESKNVKKRRK